MKQIFHKTAAVVMAFVVIFTTMSFTVGMHYCGDTLVDLAIFTEATGCGMEVSQTDVPCDDTLSQKSCCSDHQLLVEGHNDLQNTFDNYSFGQQLFVAAFYYSYSQLFEGQGENLIPFKHYKPPYVIRDVQILYETFLI